MKQEYEYYLVDKCHPLPAEYVPGDLVVAPIPFAAPINDPKCLICSIVYFPLKSLYYASRDAGLCLYGISAYRSYYRQAEIYQESIKNRGINHTRKYIAVPGTSEHQTGLAIDLSCPANDFLLTESFADTAEGKWLADNVHKFGFALSYPKDKVKVTGYNYEPWHIRFTCKYAKFYV